MELQFKKLRPNAILPKYMTDGAACFDLFVQDDTTVTIAPGSSMMIHSGLACAFPKGYVMLMHSRSGHGAKHSVRLSNCTGVIDSDYRGELVASVRNEGYEWFVLNPGDRFAQAMMVRLSWVDIGEVQELPSTARGEGGFGSTG